jgi:hypothetical protein
MNGRAGERDISWPLDNRRILSWIEGRSMAWAEQQPAGRVILDGTTCVCTYGVECDEIAVREMHQHSGIAVGW